MNEHLRRIPGTALSTLALALLLAACGGSSAPTTTPATTTSTVGASTFVAQTPIPIGGTVNGTTCPAGGNSIDYGIDSNADGLLTGTEIKGTAVICNGTSGGPTGPTGPTGSTGSTGPTGPTGPTGTPGISTLIAISDVPNADMTDCPLGNGGIKIQLGIDSNGNGILDALEVNATRNICTGGGGTNVVVLAAALVTDAKFALEGEMADQNQPLPPVLDILGKFASAAALDPTNKEAAFYASFFRIFTFMDSGATTNFLTSANLLPFRYEVGVCDAFNNNSNNKGSCPVKVFDPAAPIVVGGTDSYVNLTGTQIKSWALGGLPTAAQAAYNMLAGLGSSFTSTLLLRDQGRLATFTDTEVKVLQAFVAAEAGFLQLGNIWTTPEVDAFISDSSTRNPTTGQLIASSLNTGTHTNNIAGVDDISNSDLQAWLVGGVPANATPTPGTAIVPLQANASGVLAVQTAFKNAFGSMAAALGNLVSGSYAGELKLTGTLNYDQEPAVNVFKNKLLAFQSAALRDAFDPATVTAPTIHFLKPIAHITSFGSCTPLAANPSATDTHRNLNPFGFVFPSTTTIGANVTSIGQNFGNPAFLPLTPVFSGGGFGTYMLNLGPFTSTSQMNGGISIFSRGTGHISAAVGYSVGVGTSITIVDNELGSSINGNFGFSFSAADFDGINHDGVTLPVPSVGSPVTLWVAVFAPVPLGGGTYEVYAQDGSAAAPPIFYRGGAHTFAVQVWDSTEQLSGAQFINYLGSLWDYSTRSSARVDAGQISVQIPLNAGSFLGPLAAIFPGQGTPTVTHDPTDPGDPSGFYFDPFMEGVNVVPGQTASVNVTASIGTIVSGATVPGTFCANVQDLNTSNDDLVEGGFSL